MILKYLNKSIAIAIVKSYLTTVFLDGYRIMKTFIFCTCLSFSINISNTNDILQNTRM